MRRRLVFLTVFVVLAVAGLAARAADPLETFLRHSEDPAQFDARDMDPAFRLEVRDGVTRRVLNKDQTITLAARARGVITHHRLKSLEVQDRQARGQTIRVAYLVRAELGAQNGSYDLVYRVTGTLRPGGPNGFIWLDQLTEQLPHNARS